MKWQNYTLPAIPAFNFLHFWKMTFVIGRVKLRNIPTPEGIFN